MKGRKVFVDTNILLYAHDRDAGTKHEYAKETVLELWNNSILPAISIQVLQELYVNLIRKNISSKDAYEFVVDYLKWDVVENDTSLLLEGIKIRDRWKISFWDALIIAAAKQSGAEILFTEDLNSNQKYENILAQNPLQP